MPTANQTDAIALLRAAGLGWDAARDLASRFPLSLIERQVAWLPLRPNVHEPVRFLAWAIENDLDAPQSMAARAPQPEGYAASVGAGFRLSPEMREYYAAADALHEHVWSVLSQKPEAEQARLVAQAEAQMPKDWPNLRPSSDSWQMALDRVLAGLLGVEFKGAKKFLPMPTRFGDWPPKHPGLERVRPEAAAPAPLAKDQGVPASLEPPDFAEPEEEVPF